MRTLLIALALIAGTASANAADLDKGGKGAFLDVPAETPRVNWTGPWVAVMGGYSILSAYYDGYDIGESTEGGFVQGELGYDFQVADRFVVGGFLCASYSAIEGLADGYCVQTRGGFLLNRQTLLFGNVGWRWQGVDGEGEDSIYASGPVAGIGIESKLSQNLSVKAALERHWITDVDGESVLDEIDLGDNRAMVGLVLRLN